MKKIVIKIITIVLAFFAGIFYMGFFYNKGNLDMTSHMPEATLPVLYFSYGEQLTDPVYGYTARIDASCLRDNVLPLDGDRTIHFLLEMFDTKLKSAAYEVRTTDMERLIQDGTLEELSDSGSYLEGNVKIKDLLEDGEEYFLIFRIDTEEHEGIQYFIRVKNSSDSLVGECLGFAMDFHNATLDPENDYPLTQYLETDTTRQETSLAKVDIKSRYKNVIWAGMEVKQTEEPTVTFLELEDDVTALQLSYAVSYQNEDGVTEDYEVKDYFRIRKTNLRMYLLDYERTAERIFLAESDQLQAQSIRLGIQWEDVQYLSNEEGNVVNFVVSDELWSFDIAQNKLSKVFSFKNGSDPRGLHDDFEIRLIQIKDSGSMDFLVTGYMNRGRHEGETGTAVMRYDSLTNTTEELLFIESDQCADVLSQTIGELAYINSEEEMYLSCKEVIYAIDLNEKTAETLTEELEADNYVISKAGDVIAWSFGEDRYASSKIMTMDMKTGIRRAYQAESGELLRPLGFSGEDFLYGICREDDIYEDFAGNILFPMYQVRIVSNQGEVIRSFDYLSKNKYVLSAKLEDNRIQLSCVEKTQDGIYAEALDEAITSNEEEESSSIVLTEVSDPVKKMEEVLEFQEKAEGKRKNVTPKQVLFEDNRRITLPETAQEAYHTYGRGRVLGIYTELRDAVMTAYENMGAVTDEHGQVVWKRGGRKTRSVLALSEGCEPVNAQSSLAAGMKLLLEQQGIYADIEEALSQGRNPYRILQENSKQPVENLTGCQLSAVLYYVSEGGYVLAVTDAQSAQIITGYDSQNIYTLDALTGQATKIGMKDAAAQYESSGNVFFAFPAVP